MAKSKKKSCGCSAGATIVSLCVRMLECGINPDQVHRVLRAFTQPIIDKSGNVDKAEELAGTIFKDALRIWRTTGANVVMRAHKVPGQEIQRGEMVTMDLRTGEMRASLGKSISDFLREAKGKLDFAEDAARKSMIALTYELIKVGVPRGDITAALDSLLGSKGAIEIWEETQRIIGCQATENPPLEVDPDSEIKGKVDSFENDLGPAAVDPPLRYDRISTEKEAALVGHVASFLRSGISASEIIAFVDREFGEASQQDRNRVLDLGHHRARGCNWPSANVAALEGHDQAVS